jgi:hypothetical protein
MSNTLAEILNANLTWLQQVVTLCEQPPLIWYFCIGILFCVLGFIKALITIR